MTRPLKCPLRVALTNSKENWTSKDVSGHAADVWGQGMPWSIDFGSLKIGSDLRFRNAVHGHEAAGEESTYA